MNMVSGIRKRMAAAAGTVVVLMCAAAVGPAQAAVADQNYADITGAGSTWSFNAIDTWIKDVAQYGITVNYSPNGSTAGRQMFSQNTVNFGASEIPYGLPDVASQVPAPTRGYSYMPDTAGGTTFMYNLHVGTQQITDLRLSGDVIAKIFTNAITNWSDPAIAADNPGLTLPNEQINPVVRSDGSGASYDFTAWMLGTDASVYNNYCKLPDVNRNPCEATSIYPVDTQKGHMIGQSGDAGVSGYVSQPQAEGSIGYVEYSYAIQAGFPVAKVLNAAGYYTLPTPGHIAVSLLKAQINTDPSSQLYLTENLSGVYTDPDPRTYELSAYSYMILPTDTAGNMSSAQGNTLATFGQYALCQGQTEVDNLGYSALPINLVQDGYAELQKIPGNTLPNVTSQFIQNCHNPTFSTDGTNTLADTDPQPLPCDKQGPTMCTSSTGGAPGSGGAGGGDSGGGSGNGGGTGGAGGSGGSGGSGSSGGSGGSSSSASPGSGGTTSSGGAGSGGHGTSGGGATGRPGAGPPGAGGTGGTTAGSGGTAAGTGGTPAGGSPGSTGAGSGGTLPSCDPNTGICGGGTSTGGNTSAGISSNITVTGQNANAIPVASATGLGDGVQVALMALAASLLLGMCVVPPVIAQGNRRRRRQGGPR